MGRLDLRDKQRDEDDSADSPVTSEALGTGERPLAETETEIAFLARLKRLGNDWRYSDEFIGMIVRNRFPRDYAA